MTTASILKQALIKLSPVIPQPQLEAELLLALITKKTREFLITHPETKITKQQLAKFNKLIARRLNHEPLAYLTGHKEFYGLDFLVNKHVLVPRPETELIINQVLNSVREIKNQKSTTIIDLGTGSGCIVITLAKKTKAKFWAIDISKSALTVAKKNARQHRVSRCINFLHSDLLNKLLKTPHRLTPRTNVIITANLPYLTKQEIKSELSISREPRLALDGGSAGLALYKKLAKQVKQLIKIYTPTSLEIFCEINPNQTSTMKKIFAGYQIKIIKDYNKKNRLINCFYGSSN